MNEPLGSGLVRTLVSTVLLVMAALGFALISAVLGRVGAPNPVFAVCALLYLIGLAVAYGFIKSTTLGRFVWDVRFWSW